MKYIITSILLFVIYFSVNKYGVSANSFDDSSNVSDAFNIYPVNLVDFKLTLVKYIHHVCEKNEERLTQMKSDVSECISAHDLAKDKCEVKVLRLAPFNIENKEDLDEYGQDYQQCTLPYKNLVG